MEKTIERKKKELATKKVRFVPDTNCMLELNSVKYNLNVCDENTLKSLMINLHMYEMAAQDLGINPPEYSGYEIDAWISDIKQKLEVATNKKEEAKLKIMEQKLDKLLSDDKKTELELDEIAASL